MLEAHLRRDARCRAAYAALGPLLREMGRLDEAERHLRRALAMGRDADTLAELALVHIARGSIELAHVTALQAELVDERHAKTQNVIGLVGLARGNVVDAYRRFVRATDLADQIELWMNRGQLALSVRAYDDALLSFRRATRLRPGFYDAWIGLGVALRGNGDLEQAKLAYERAIALRDERPEAHFNLAVLAHDHSPLDEATLGRARRHYQAFLVRADSSLGDSSLANARREVERRCEGRAACRPGRLQLLEQVTEALGIAP